MNQAKLKYIFRLFKTAIMLVPEISLTPNMLRIFRSRFGETVAILHSGLSAGDFRTQLRGSCFNAMFQTFVQYPQFLLSCNQIPVFFDGRFIGRKKKIRCLMKICGNVIG